MGTPIVMRNRKKFIIDNKIGQVTWDENDFNTCRIKGTKNNVLEYQDYKLLLRSKCSPIRDNVVCTWARWHKTYT